MTKNMKLAYACLFIVGVVLAIVALKFNPSFVSHYLSSDGALEKSTIVQIYIIGASVFLFALIICLYSLTKISSGAFSKNVSQTIETILLGGPLLPRVIIIFSILLLLTTTVGLVEVYDKGRSARGFEYLWVAQSISGGHGFSLSADHRWFFYDFKSSYSPDEYFPTALEEPVYPAFMAIFFNAFGEYGRLVILLLQVIALTGTCVLLYYLGRAIFNPQTGILAGSILALWPAARSLAAGDLGPPIFGGLFVVISACLIIWCLQKVSAQRGIALGLMLGFSALTLAPTLFFIPVSMLFVFLSAHPVRPVVWKTALAILLTASIVVSPWTIRNFLVFGELVPVRTGLGLITHQGNPILAATVSQGLHACSDTLGPLWKAKNIPDAIRLGQNNSEKRFAIYRRSFDCIQQKAPDGYENFNEAKRDKVYLKQSFNFIFSEPFTFVSLTYYKILAFFAGWNWSQTAVALLALAGAVITLRVQGARVLALLALAYAAPYCLGMPWFYRYRYPIEPVFFLLASHSLILAASHLKEFALKWAGRARIRNM